MVLMGTVDLAEGTQHWPLKKKKKQFFNIRGFLTGRGSS
jgi:hypothetical protein